MYILAYTGDDTIDIIFCDEPELIDQLAYMTGVDELNDVDSADDAFIVLNSAVEQGLYLDDLCITVATIDGQVVYKL